MGLRGMMEQVGDRTATGTARTPVALRIARHAAQVLLASGILTREVRQDAEIAKQDASRSLRLCELLLSIYQTRTTPAVPERAPKRGGPCRIPPRRRPHFSISRRGSRCLTLGLPRRPRHGRPRPQPRQDKRAAIKIVYPADPDAYGLEPRPRRVATRGHDGGRHDWSAPSPSRHQSVHHLDHLAHARIDLARPALAGEHAVMADAGLQMVAA